MHIPASGAMGNKSGNTGDTKAIPSRNWHTYMAGAAILLLGFVLIFTFLGFPLFDPDEPVYGETAREMIFSGDWLSPRIYGKFWYDKPPLFYWLTAISYSFFGINEWSSRLPSALLGVTLPIFMFFSLRRVIGMAAAAASAVILLTSPLYFYLARAAVTDMTLTFALTVAMISFWKKQYVAFYVCCGLAMLTKGPIGYGFPALIIILYFLCTKQPSALLHMKLHWGIPLALAVGLPWYFAMYAVHGQDFINGFLEVNNIIRFAAPEHPGRNSLFFFIPVLIAGFLPWFGALGQSVYHGFRIRGNEGKFLLFLNIWAWFVFLFFSVSKTQLLSYILPMFPPLSILAGVYVRDLFASEKSDRLWSVLYILTGLTAISAVLYFHAKVQGILPHPLLLPLILTALSFAAVFALRWLGLFRFLTVQAVGMSVFALTATGFYAPCLAGNYSSKTMSQELIHTYDGTSPLYIDKFLRPGIAFYSGWYGHEILTGDPKKILQNSGNSQTYYLIRNTAYKRLAENRLLPAGTVILSQYGQSILFCTGMKGTSL